MTKLVIGLAVVVVVVLIIVILAARNMRAGDREDFGERSGDRSQSRGRTGGSDWRDYDRRERSVRQPARDGRPGVRQSARPQSPAGRRPAGGRGDRHLDDQRMADTRGHEGSRGHEARRRDDGSRDRQGRGKRSDDSADWPSTEWDKLSDVDYWAELASDKPLTTTARPAAPARPAPAVHDRDAYAAAGHGTAGQAAAGHGAAGGQVPRLEADSGLPVRGRPQLAAAPVPLDAMPLSASPRQPAAAAHQPDRGAPAAPQARSLPGSSLPGSTVPGAVYQGQRHVQVDPDDDPLTSPSFPRVPADDSRSYRSSRGGPPGGPQAAQSAPTQQFASYGSPAAQFGGQVGPLAERAHPAAYPDYLPGPGPYPGIDRAPGSDRTDSYRTRSGSHARPGLDAGGAHGGPVSAAGAVPLPSGNPYGSYVSTPPSGGFPGQPAQDPNGHADGSYPPAQDLSGHASDWYPRHGGSTPPGPGGHGTVAGPAGYDPQAPGSISGERGYYPPGSPAQGGYLPASYPRVPSASHGQYPYGQDGGYGGPHGYDATGH